MSYLTKIWMKEPREYIFKIDTCVIEKSVLLIKQHSQDVNYNYLQEVRRISQFEESEMNREVEFEYVSDSVDVENEKLRKEMAYRLFYFHKFVGNQSTFEETRRYKTFLISDGTDVTAAINVFMGWMIQKMDKVETIRYLDSYCGNILILSTIFSFPFPSNQDDTPDQQLKEKLTSWEPFQEDWSMQSIFNEYDDHSSEFLTFFNEYRQLKVDYSEGDYDVLLDSTSILKRIVDRALSFPCVVYTTSDSKPNFAVVFSNAILYPVIMLLNLEFGHIFTEYKDIIQNISRPDIYLSRLLNGVKFAIPLEFKFSGLMETYLENGIELVELLNQSIYQMLTLSSHIGFICDKDSILVIKLSPEINPTMTTDSLMSIKMAKVNCEINCYNYKSLGFSPSFLIYSLIKSYFEESSTDNLLLVRGIFESMKLKNDEKEEVKNGKYNFLVNEWKTGFREYKLEGDYYVRDDISKLKIPTIFIERIFDEDINFEDTIHQSEFEIVGIIQESSDERKHNSNVYRVKRLKDESVNPSMILKIYDPTTSTYLKGYTQVSTFWNSNLYCLGMFLNELRAYRMLGRRNSRGIYMEIPHSASDTEPQDEESAAPYIYSYGFLDWIHNGKRLCGYYLLMEEVPCNYPDTEEIFQILAESSLLQIHSRNIEHGDIRLENFRYDALKGKVIFFDFSSSIVDKEEHSYLPTYRRN
ncbi:hypothetical protein DFJ63DRAFT_311489 [Scheffersomyces coipomensis]|uniref:uncharacterized protein n=1 Tax=Scheffersomyces coipomensis TaxID=1788519 RepID=UPI00315D7059